MKFHFIFQVSGTAAKLGGKVAYHHCTLLVNTNLNSVDKFLFGSEVNTNNISNFETELCIPVIF